MVIPVRDRADAIGRTVTCVLAQTFADVEVVVVDDGSADDTVAAARAVADHRVRILRRPPEGPAPSTAAGLAAATGRWVAVLDPDTSVHAAWLARLGRLADATGAHFVTCGGEHLHTDGSRTEILPRPSSTDPLTRACLRSGAFVTERDLLVAAMDRPPSDPLHASARPASVAGGDALRRVIERGGGLAWTPERLVAWHDRAPTAPTGDELRLDWALQALDVLARAPIPDADLLARYATIGGVAAARLRRRRDARLLFRIACRARPEVRKHWARYAVSCLSPLSDRIWDPTDPAADPAAGGGGGRGRHPDRGGDGGGPQGPGRTADAVPVTS